MKKLKLYAIKTIRMDEADALEVEALSRLGISLVDILKSGIKTLNDEFDIPKKSAWHLFSICYNTATIDNYGFPSLVSRQLSRYIGIAGFFLVLDSLVVPIYRNVTRLLLGKNLSSIYPWKSNCPETNQEKQCGLIPQTW